MYPFVGCINKRRPPYGIPYGGLLLFRDSILNSVWNLTGISADDYFGFTFSVVLVTGPVPLLLNAAP